MKPYCRFHNIISVVYYRPSDLAGGFTGEVEEGENVGDDVVVGSGGEEVKITWFIYLHLKLIN